MIPESPLELNAILRTSAPCEDCPPPAFHYPTIRRPCRLSIEFIK